MARAKASGKKPSTGDKPKPVMGEQIEQLRAKIAELRERIGAERRLHGFRFPALEAAAQAGRRLSRDLAALGRKGYELGEKLQTALYRNPKQLRDQALSMLRAMKTELEQRAEEIRLKSEQLNELIRRSGQQALKILQSKPKRTTGKASARTKR